MTASESSGVPPQATKQPGSFSFETLVTGTSSVIGFVVGSLFTMYVQQFLNERADMRRQLSERHRPYSDCMELIYDYARVKGDNYANVFQEEMTPASKGTPRSDEVKRVNQCRSLTKDYWRFALYFAQKHANSAEKAELKSQYQRFVALVRPMDKLPGYENDPTDLYTATFK